MIGVKKSWKGLKSLEEAFQLIDYGVVLKWREMRTLKRNFSIEDRIELVRYFVKRFCERAQDRLSAEITVESCLIWLANGGDERLVEAFIDEMLHNPECELAAKILVEIALTHEVADQSHDEELFSVAVALVCELGSALRQFHSRQPDAFEDYAGLIGHVTTYLISVSNSNSTFIRLCLLHYFGKAATYVPPSPSDNFNKIIGRFGHTVLDHLFDLLFKKRTEAVALQYLLENIPFLLRASHHGQRILHETMKFYMLKHPDRFGLFAQLLSKHVLSMSYSSQWQPGDREELNRVLIQHIGALLKVAVEVNHKALVKEMAHALLKFEAEHRVAVVQEVVAQGPVKEPVRTLLKHLSEPGCSEKTTDNISQFRSNKRGRKPSFARTEVATLNQMSFLGGMNIAKAS